MKKNKKILLVTWSRGNYGTFLQCYSLYKTLQNLGLNVALLADVPKSYTLYSFLCYVYNLIGLKCFFSKISSRIKSDFKSQKFISLFYETYKVVYIGHRKHLSNLSNYMDVFVTGSDQIWNTYVEYNPVMFLNFVKNKKKIAYASSIGSNNVPKAYSAKVREHLLDFDSIAVREKTSVQTLIELTGRKDIIQVVDPTFLLSSDEWNPLIKEAKLEFRIPKNYTLCYLIGCNDYYKEQVLSIIRKMELSNIIILSSLENPNFTIDGAYVYNYAGPAEFLYLISNASLVITDSFHATALSINFKKNFVELLRFSDDSSESQNTRIYDILKNYGLTNRLYSENQEDWNKPITSYHDIHQKLINDRKHSMEYLLNAIEK